MTCRGGLTIRTRSGGKAAKRIHKKAKGGDRALIMLNDLKEISPFVEVKRRKTDGIVRIGGD